MGVNGRLELQSYPKEESYGDVLASINDLRTFGNTANQLIVVGE